MSLGKNQLFYIRYDLHLAPKPLCSSRIGHVQGQHYAQNRVQWLVKLPRRTEVLCSVLVHQLQGLDLSS